MAHLDAVTNRAFGDLKTRLIRSLNDHKNPPPDTVGKSTNRVAAATNAAVATSNAAPPPPHPPTVSPENVRLQAAPPALREQKP
jgi:hypothetical protein